LLAGGEAKRSQFKALARRLTGDAAAEQAGGRLGGSDATSSPRTREHMLTRSLRRIRGCGGGFEDVTLPMPLPLTDAVGRRRCRWPIPIPLAHTDTAGPYRCRWPVPLADADTGVLSAMS